MRSSSQAMQFIMAAVLLLLILTPASNAAITCSDVLRDLRPCLSYLQNGNGMPPSPCCAGAKTLAASATTTPDKQAACNCIKSTASSLGVKPELAKALPGNCGISLPFPVSSNVDCTKIS